MAKKKGKIGKLARLNQDFNDNFASRRSLTTTVIPSLQKINTDIKALYGKIANLKQQIDIKRGRVANNTSQINNNQAGVAQLTGQLTQLTIDKENLEKRYDDLKQKTVISNQYLLPKIREQVKFSQEDIVIPDDVINYIIENYCNKEDGVRNMKRCLEIIYTKLNLYRLMRPGSNLFEKDMSLKVEFPIKVTRDIVDKLVKKEGRNDNFAISGMYL
jgi:hypothetical protein